MTGPTPPGAPWARAQGGPPAPGSPLDEQLAAFVGPRWNVYRRKFAPFFDDARFQPTWNWAAALLSPGWFLYRKLYVPFVFFAFVPTVAFGLLWGDRPPAQPLPTPGAPIPEELRDAMVLMLGVYLSTSILAGGTANFLLFRRATAALALLAPREADQGARLAVLRRVGGVSWASVAVGIGVLLVLQAVLGAAAGSAG